MKKTIFFTILFLSMPALADNSLFGYLTTSQKALIFYPLIKNNLKDHYLSKNEGYYYLPKPNEFTFTDRPSWNLSALSAEWTMQAWYSIFTMLPGGLAGRMLILAIRDTLSGQFIKITMRWSNALLS